MALISATQWQVTSADGGSWDTIATKIGCTKQALFAANGISSFRPLVVGEILNVPFVPRLTRANPAVGVEWLHTSLINPKGGVVNVFVTMTTTGGRFSVRSVSTSAKGVSGTVWTGQTATTTLALGTSTSQTMAPGVTLAQFSISSPVW